MHSTQHLYKLIYSRLKKQILTGQLEYGSLLPSISQLARLHQVSSKTIQSALKLLQKEGLICTRKRQRAMITYQAGFLQEKSSSICLIAQKQASILDIYRTMEMIMPDILAFCSKSVSVYELPHYGKAIDWAKKPRPEGSWQICSEILHDVLRSSGNFLINSVYVSLEIQAEVPFLAEYQYLVTHYTPFSENHHVDWILNTLQSSYYTVRRNFSEHYHNTYQTMEKSFSILANLYPGIKSSGNCTFTWDAGWGWDLLHKKISRNLIEKIGTGIYSAGTLLPSEACLMEKYKVSLSTIRKSLKVLQSSGFIQTINGRGSIVQPPERWRFTSMINRSDYHQDIFIYLSALQFIPFLIRSSADLVYTHLDAAVQDELQKRFHQYPRNYLKVWTDYIIAHVPLYSLKVILEQVNKVLNWGYFYSLYPIASQLLRKLNKFGERAFKCLQTGDREGYVNGIHDGYLYLFKEIRSYFIQNGYFQAQMLKLPKRV